MGLKIKISGAGPVPNGYEARSYETRFLVQQKRLEPEEDVQLYGFNGDWRISDTKLGFPLKVRLWEFLDGGFVNVSVIAEFEKTDSSRTTQVDNYVKAQLEQIARDGMVKL